MKFFENSSSADPNDLFHSFEEQRKFSKAKERRLKEEICGLTKHVANRQTSVAMIPK